MFLYSALAHMLYLDGLGRMVKESGLEPWNVREDSNSIALGLGFGLFRRPFKLFDDCRIFEMTAVP